MSAASPDDRILALAAKQHGVCARWQLVEEGITVHIIDERLRRGRLRRQHRGVYLLPPLAGARMREVAAALAYGRRAVVSHATAASVLEAIESNAGHVAVSVPGGHPCRRAGIRVYRVRLPDAERMTHQGVPVTTPARTLVDYAGVSTRRALEQAVATMLRQRLCTESELRKATRVHAARRGAGQLAALLARDTPPAFARSEAEEQFIELIGVAGLPRPAVNVRLSGFEVDFHWAAERLVVEIDGLAYHSSRSAQARDRRRDTALGSAGHRVLRFTWFDVTERPVATAVRIAEALARAGEAPPARPEDRTSRVRR